MVKTFKELREIEFLVSRLYAENPALEKTKFYYAYKKFAEKNYVPTLRECKDAIGMAGVDNALEDPKTKEMLIDSDPKSLTGFKMDRAGWKNYLVAAEKINDEYNAKEIEVEPYISSYIPEGLTEEDREMLTGLVI